MYYFFIFIFIFFSNNTCFSAEIAITIDDFDVEESIFLSGAERSAKLLATLRHHDIKADLFVACKFIQTQKAKQLLGDWDNSGYLIGNHSYNHPYLGKSISAEKYINSEIIPCENELKVYHQFQKKFRFPMLAEGDTVQKRDQLRTWFKTNDYSIGHVTIDTSDWYIDQRMRDKILTDPKFDLTKFRDYYLEHIWDRAKFYNKLSLKVLGREVKHTILLHFNLINAMYLNDLILMFKQKDWNVISADKAFRDDAFKSEPRTMPSGQSLIWALARESGKFESDLRYPGENEVYEKPKMDALGL